MSDSASCKLDDKHAFSRINHTYEIEQTSFRFAVARAVRGGVLATSGISTRGASFFGSPSPQSAYLCLPWAFRSLDIFSGTPAQVQEAESCRVVGSAAGLRAVAWKHECIGVEAVAWKQCLAQISTPSCMGHPAQNSMSEAHIT
jgi:hypothetical protein